MTSSCFMGSVTLRHMRVVATLLNVFLFIKGAALTGLGVWLHYDPDFVLYHDPDSSYIMHGANALICLGLVVIALAIVGCCGILNERFCLLETYSAGVGSLLLGKFYFMFAIYMCAEYMCYYGSQSMDRFIYTTGQ